MRDQIIRWGILGAAQIAQKNWQAIVRSGNGVVAAVASRDLERSRYFIQLCQSEAPLAREPKAMGSYEELLASPEIDAVYVPLPTGLRKEWVMRAAEAGKHVVCEKPCAPSSEDLKEMIDACARHGVQFMDGVMFVHSRRMERIREVLNQPNTIGDLRRMSAQFSFPAPPDFFTSNIRASSKLEPLGCLGDLGWYCVRFFLWAMNWQMPEKVSGRLLASHPSNAEDGAVPTQFSAELFFQDGPTASFYVSFETANQQWMHLSGDQGYLRVDDFVLPWFGNELEFETNSAEFEVEGCRFNMARHPRTHRVSEYSNNHESAQEARLFRTFADQVLSGQLNSDWPEMSLKTQQVIDACLQSAR